MMCEANNLSITIQNDILYQISLQGDAMELERLIREDALSLDRVSSVTLYGESLLHIAAMRGHFNFARVLIAHKPQLALQSDSLNRLPLHWACEKGYTHIVIELLHITPDACFWRDLDGKMPLHLAVIKGRNDVIVQLVRSQPESIRETVENGGTILHLCVQYNSFDALKLLLSTSQGRQLVNALDDHGNTILDLAAIFNQVEIIRYLLSQRIDISMKGFTSVEAAGCFSMETKIHSPAAATSVAQKCKNWWNKYMTNVEFGLEKARGSILVAATVTASMAFQAGINPPHFNNHVLAHREDTRAFAYPLINNILNSDGFQPNHGFWLFNSKSLIFSLAIIMLMQSGIPIRNKLFNVILVISMCSVVMSTLLAYYFAAKEANLVEDYLQVYIKVFAVMFYMVIVLHVCTLVMCLVSKVFNVPKC